MALVLGCEVLAMSGCASPMPEVRSDPASAALELRPDSAQLVAEPRHSERDVTRVEPDALVLDEENSIFFALSSSRVAASEGLKLRRHADDLVENEARRVILIGHADNLGSHGFNLAVSEKRVNEVSRQLRSYGVAASQIRRYAVGSEKMPKNCRSEICRKKMRRVDLIFSK